MELVPTYAFWRNYLKNSPNTWHRKAYSQVVLTQKNIFTAERMLSQAVSPNGAGANLPLCEELKIHVFKEEEYSKLAMIMPVTQCLNDDFYAKKPIPVFHISTEILREYYIGWIIKKKSIWRNVLNGHILKYQQVFNSDNIQLSIIGLLQAGLHINPRKILLKKLEDLKAVSNPEIRVLEINDFIFPGIVLAIGLTISIIVFAFELIFVVLFSYP